MPRMTGQGRLLEFLCLHGFEHTVTEVIVAGRMGRYGRMLGEPGILVRAFGRYDNRDADIRVWFTVTGSFVRWEIRVPGVNFKAFPRTLKCLLEDDGFGSPLLADMAPQAERDRLQRDRERHEATQAERQRRAEALEAESLETCIATLTELNGVVRAQVPSLTPIAAENILLAILGADRNDPELPLMRFLKARDALNSAIGVLRAHPPHSSQPSGLPAGEVSAVS